MKSLVFIFLCVVGYSQAYHQEGTCHHWVKLNSAPVCFSGKNNHPGTFTPIHSGFVAAVKLVHLTGKIRCGHLAGEHNSNWGCYNWPGLLNHPLNVFVTSRTNKVLFPRLGLSWITGALNPAKWYSIEGFNSRSKELVLKHGFNDPHYLGPESVLRLWYGEDLYNKWEGDNVGTVCADVYGHIV